ncbi:hypothetical protein ASD15_17425 [Massilia sp. Root351]|uniref:DUF4123 domain-containing protein n=1 Tax=Massilia sp. Root351 TaxID=1736522 RepID=UPI0007088DAD|nr:DUF4123 domain-containing protein [Massilia sp. Root351]KQV79808.1 hypothetical protein ASD15_17425 [Massilia sp. Root351]
MKKNDFYAQDPIMVSAAIDTLGVLTAAQPDLHWAALIDSAFDYPAGATLPYAAGSINCYTADEFQGLQKAAPWLVPIHGDYRSEAHFRSILRHCAARPMISFLASRVPLAELSEHWRSLHRVSVVDQQKMLLRFADTRVLSALPDILAPSQWLSYSSPLVHWLVLERTGTFTQIPLAPAGALPDQSIKLSEPQVDALLIASQPDAIIELLKNAMSDVVPDSLRNSEFYELISGSCQLAASHGIELFADVFSLAVAACLTMGETNRSSEVDALLRARCWPAGDLGDMLVAEGLV